MTRNIFIGVAIVVAFVALAVSFHGTPIFGAAGTEHTQTENFYGGFTVGNASYTATTKKNCTAVTSWNPPSVSSTTAGQLDVAAPSGYTIGDQLDVQLGTSTQGLGIMAVASTSATASVLLFDPDNTGAAIDISTTTYQLCYRHSG